MKRFYLNKDNEISDRTGKFNQSILSDIVDDLELELEFFEKLEESNDEEDVNKKIQLLYLIVYNEAHDGLTDKGIDTIIYKELKDIIVLFLSELGYHDALNIVEYEYTGHTNKAELELNTKNSLLYLEMLVSSEGNYESPELIDYKFKELSEEDVKKAKELKKARKELNKQINILKNITDAELNQILDEKNETGKSLDFHIKELIFNIL